MAEEPRHDDKLARILRTAAAIFADKGYHEASIRDISRATGISLSGLYYYFRSKEELLFLIQDHCFGTVLDNLERLLEGVMDPHRRLRLLVENHLRFFVSNMKEMKVLSHEAGSLTGDYRKRVNEKKRRYTELCTATLQELRPASPIDLRVATFALFGMMNWIYNWYHADRDVPVAELAEDLSQLFLQGYLGDAGLVPAGAAERAPGEARPSIWRRTS
ncbi:MAG: TetR/AcrR family transcriptional regulator [Gemmatimonadetes bacterium]|nr:TetR/AcrR family transcriptional regulator [Gemmatimonadota bacterium]